MSTGDAAGAPTYLTREVLTPATLDPITDAWRAEGTMGAVVSFAGVVRADRTDGGAVTAIEFTSHEEMAEQAIAELVARVIAETAGDEPEYSAAPQPRVFLRHALGRVPVGGCPIVIAVATGHRRRAFAICEGVLEALKHEVPIWGREIGTDGAQWKVNH